MIQDKRGEERRARPEKTRQRKRQEETREDKGESVPKRAILRYTRPQTDKRSFETAKPKST